MKIYRNLVFRGSKTAIERFIGELEGRLTDGWMRYQAGEARVEAAAFGAYCFACPASGPRLAAEIWMWPRPDGFEVTNILPIGRPSMTHDEYNTVVQDFHDLFAGPAAQATGVTVELGRTEFQIEDLLSASTARLLHEVSENRLRMFRIDRERWNRFLTAAHNEGTTLDGPKLYRWLVENEKWPEYDALNLSDEYEHARELLGVYESQHA